MFIYAPINFRQIWPGLIKPLLRPELGRKDTQFQSFFIEWEDLIMVLEFSINVSMKVKRPCENIVNLLLTPRA